MIKVNIDTLNTKLSIAVYILTIFTALGGGSAVVINYFFPKHGSLLIYAVCFCLASGIIVAVLLMHNYIVSLRSRINNFNIVIEGIPITALNLANAIRAVNRDYKVEAIMNNIEIDNSDLRQSLQSKGIKIKNTQGNNSFEYSIDMDSNLKLSQIDCYGFDLNSDPQKTHRITPVLKSTDGFSKKLSVPFLTNIRLKETFNVVLNATTPGCMLSGKDYFFHTIALACGEPVRTVEHTLTFKGSHPTFVRLYQVDNEGKVSLLRPVPLKEIVGNEAVYYDKGMDVDSNVTYVYIFERLY